MNVYFGKGEKYGEPTRATHNIGFMTLTHDNFDIFMLN